MTATDMWRIAELDLHGAGYKTLVCCPENALTGDPAQFEGLIAVPFPHILRRAFFFTSSVAGISAGPVKLFKAIVGGTFSAVGVNASTIQSGAGANIIDLHDPGAFDLDQEEATDTLGALYRLEMDLGGASGTVNDLGLAVMVTPIPGGGFQHAQ